MVIIISSCNLEINNKYLHNSCNKNLWIKCNSCNNILYLDEINENFKICTYCNSYFRLRAKERIEFTFDKETFKEFKYDGKIKKYLNFPGYIDKFEKIQKELDMEDAVITGVGKIEGIKVVACIMDSYFMMGSMGNIVGEKITQAIENAINKKMPLIIFTCSGGARIQEGVVALMQMSKISAALKKLSNNNLLYITVLTNPTTGGVLASFGMLGDIILAEPSAVVGFAGKRVIENTLKEKIPENFQTSEFMFEHGFIDKVVERKNMKLVLSKLLRIHTR